jgi:LMBR1 domain-containing protein 1
LIFYSLEELEQKEAALERNEESIKVVRRSLFFKCRFLYRPVQIIIGVLLLLFALLIFISLLLSNINKSIHFINFKQVFAQGNKTIPNPIDITLTWAGRVSGNFLIIKTKKYSFLFKFYPLDYILLSLLLAYIIITSIFGLQQLGIWYFWLRVCR